MSSDEMFKMLTDKAEELLQMKEKHEFIEDEIDDPRRLVDYTEIQFNEDDGYYTVTYVMEDGFENIFITDDRDKAYKAYNSPNKRLFYDNN